MNFYRRTALCSVPPNATWSSLMSQAEKNLRIGYFEFGAAARAAWPGLLD